MTSLKISINLRYIYFTLKPRIIVIKTYQYENYFLLPILIYFNSFRKYFLTKTHVPQIESLYLVIMIATWLFFSSGDGTNIPR